MLVAFSLLILSYVFDLISSTPRKRKLELQSWAIIFGKVLLMLTVISFIEFFLFFSSRLGRVVYFNLFVFLSLFFMMEERLKHLPLLKKKADKIGWLSKVSPEEVIKEYKLDGSIEILRDFRKENPDVIVYDYSLKDPDDVKSIVRKMILGTKAMDLISFIESKTQRIPLKYVDHYWLLYNLRPKGPVYTKFKNLIDFLGAALLLIFIFPIGFLFALAHCFESKGPIFYRQERLGFRGKKFKLIKFRTMIPEAEKDGPRFASENDPRITRIGRLMRRYRIDEIPQLINVLKGEMSLIGPRPEREAFVEKLEKEIPFYRLRLEVKPGITGWAQVNHRYAGEDIESHKIKLEYDLYYIKNRNLFLDIIILLKTVKIMLVGTGR